MKHVALTIVAAIACGHGDEPSSTRPPALAPTPGSAVPTIHATAAFVDVTLVPMDAEHELAHQTVLVDGDRIVAVGPVATTNVPAGATAIAGAGAGKWLVPGLVDMHVHYNDVGDGVLYLANGVTTVRNMWGGPAQLAWRDQARKHDPSYIGPTIFTAGPIVDGDPPIWPGSTVVHDAKQAEAEVTAEKAAGYDFVKVYDNLSLVAYDAIAAAARDQHFRFAGHMPLAVSLEHALASDQASIEHLTGYPEAAQDATSHAATTKGPARRAELVHHLDQSKIAALAKQTADAKVANCPTLVVLDRISHLDHPEALQARPELAYVAPAQLASWDPKHDFRFKSMTPDMFETMRAGASFRNALVKALSDAGAPILAGTDTSNPYVVAGFALYDELALLVGAGLTPYQALRAATAAAGDWLGDPGIGRIATGAHADLVLLDADPLAEITATTKRSGVMVRGAWMTKSDLDARLVKRVEDLKPKDRFTGAPALAVPTGEVLFAASYKTAIGTFDFGAERLAIVRVGNGGRVIVAQAASSPPAPRFASVREELDAAGKLVRFAVEEDGKRATAIATAGKLHVDVEGGTSRDVAFPADELVDSNFVATMIAFADRAKSGAKTKVVGMSLTGAGELTDVTYVFDRTGAVPKFVVTSPQGTASGTFELDDGGFPKRVALQLGPANVVVTRQ